MRFSNQICQHKTTTCGVYLGQAQYLLCHMGAGSPIPLPAAPQRPSSSAAKVAVFSASVAAKQQIRLLQCLRRLRAEPFDLFVLRASLNACPVP